jgi:hypothetical protein
MAAAPVLEFLRREDMRTPRLALAAFILSTLAFFAWEGRRAFLALLVRRGDFVRLERWGGDSCFIPAARFHYSPRGKDACCHDPLAAWATRRFRPRFPVDKVMDLAWLPSNELILLLRQDPEVENPQWTDEARLVVLDLNHDEEVVAESQPFDMNAWGFEIRYFPAWEGPTFFVQGGGTGSCSMLFRREGRALNPIRCLVRGKMEDFFCSWLDCGLKDIDGDGIPEVLRGEGKDANCPACGRDGQCNVVTWKLVDGYYRPWTVRGEECGMTCELSWSYSWQAPP